MKALIERMYQAICNRGLITPDTTKIEFIRKMDEEDSEYLTEYYYNRNTESLSNREVEELVDSITVRIMYLKKFKLDFIKEFKKVLEKNEKRANESLRISRNKIEQ